MAHVTVAAAAASTGISAATIRSLLGDGTLEGYCDWVLPESALERLIEIAEAAELAMAESEESDELQKAQPASSVAPL